MSTDIEQYRAQSEALGIPTNELAKFWLMKEALAPDATEGEFYLFMLRCQSTGLDPFRRQIYLISRPDRSHPSGQKSTVQTGIDGYYSIAHRTGRFRTSKVWWCGEDGQWVDVWLAKGPPVAAKAQVWVNGDTEPREATVLYSEFVQTVKYDGKVQPNSQWRKMPAHMLGKCAEALCLRRAFPDDLAGIYTEEEMGAPVEATAEHVSGDQRANARLSAQLAARASAALPPATPAARAGGVGGDEQSPADRAFEQHVERLRAAGIGVTDLAPGTGPASEARRRLEAVQDNDEQDYDPVEDNDDADGDADEAEILEVAAAEPDETERAIATIQGRAVDVWGEWGPNEWIEHLRGKVQLSDLRKAPYKVTSWGKIPELSDELRQQLYELGNIEQDLGRPFTDD